MQIASNARKPSSPPSPVFKVGTQSEADPYEFVMATDDVDRMGDVIEVDGVELAGFERNPIALWNHDSSAPIGTWADVRAAGGRLLGRLKLAAEGTSPLVDRLRQLVEQRILRAVSVGFIPLEAAAIKETGGFRFTASELLECSLVAVPANANALRLKGLVPSPLDPLIFGGNAPAPTGPPVVSRAGAGGAAPTRARPGAAPPGLGTRTMNIAEKLVAAQQRTIAIDDELAAISALAEADGEREFTEDETATIASLAEEKSRVVKSTETLATLERALANRAKPAAPGLTLPARVKADKPGSLILKVAVARFLAHCSHRSVEAVIGERYREDERVKAAHDFMVKSAADIADTLTPGWAAELVREDTKGFLEDLQAVSVYAALSAMGVGIDFGTAGSITVPRRNTRGDMAGAFVGETGVIPVVQGQLGGQSLYRYKLAAISTFSKELERTATPAIEALMRQIIRQDTADLIDTKFLDAGAMIAGVRPAGILNGVVLTASSGNTPANVATDLKALLGPLVTANALDRPVILINPIRLLGLSLLTTATGEFIYKADIADNRLGTIPFIASTNVPATTVVALNAADFATAFGVPEYDVSDTATLTMANADTTAPTQAIDFTGAIGTAGQVNPGSGIHVAGGDIDPGGVGVVAMSMFQQWSVALRSVTPISWAMMRPGVVSGLSGVNW